MKVFLAASFDTRNQEWRELIRGLIQSAGGEPVEGEGLDGNSISDSVRERIAESDALIALMSVRERIGDQAFTHDWVVEEHAHASALNISCLRVVELPYRPESSIVGDREIIYFEEHKFELVMLKILSFLQAQKSRSDAAKPASADAEPDIVVRPAKNIVLTNDSIAPDFKAEAIEKVEEARACFARQDLDGALSASEEAARLDSFCWNAYVNMAGVYTIKGEYKRANDALDHAQKVIRNDPKGLAKILHNRAWALTEEFGWADRSKLLEKRSLLIEALTYDRDANFYRAVLIATLIELDELDDANRFCEGARQIPGFSFSFQSEVAKLPPDTRQKVVNALPSWVGLSTLPDLNEE